MGGVGVESGAGALLQDLGDGEAEPAVEGVLPAAGRRDHPRTGVLVGELQHERQPGGQAGPAQVEQEERRPAGGLDGGHPFADVRPHAGERVGGHHVQPVRVLPAAGAPVRHHVDDPVAPVHRPADGRPQLRQTGVDHRVHRVPDPPERPPHPRVRPVDEVQRAPRLRSDRGLLPLGDRGPEAPHRHDQGTTHTHSPPSPSACHSPSAPTGRAAANPRQVSVRCSSRRGRVPAGRTPAAPRRRRPDGRRRPFRRRRAVGRSPGSVRSVRSTVGWPPRAP